MQEVVVQAFVERIKAGLMTIEQVPAVYRDNVEKALERNESNG